MKRVKILRIFAIAVVLSLLMLIVSVLPALAVNTITLSPTSGKIGDQISVSGDAFTSYKSTGTYESDAEIYFAEDNEAVGKSIDTDVKTYKLMEEGFIDETTGDFTATFNVPTRLDDYVSSSYHDDVRTGTYYVYITINKNYYDGVTPPVISKIIRSRAIFTVTASAALDPLSPATGAGGTDVVVSGANFPVSTALVFKFDTTVITPKSGDTATRTSGIFLSTITIPASATAGAHTITVTAGTGTATATFTVSASAALDPLSPATGAGGADVVVSGANFPVSTALVFKFDATTLTPKAGTDASTRSSGIFISTVTVPASAVAGAHTITVTAGTGTATATFTVTASAALDPLDPASGPAGTEVTVSGANFPASTAVAFKFDTTTLTPEAGTDVSTRSSGAFYSIITIPTGTTAGTHTISVTVGTITLDATFTVTGGATPTPTPTATPPPSQTSINIVQNAFNVGASLGIVGVGFSPGTNATIKYAGIVEASAKVGNDSTFTVIFELPALQSGVPHQFTISDGVHTATANFTVETTAPPVPATIAPETGAKVKTPITFMWESVTDASSPVTYNFQIATNNTFAADSIVLEKKALDKSELILSEAEELKLPGQEAPYYWRVKAVDAALNESAWTGAVDFYTSVPSSFPKWAIYLIGIVGGLFLLLIGFWIGRRTAFYY